MLCGKNSYDPFRADGSQIFKPEHAALNMRYTTKGEPGLFKKKSEVPDNDLYLEQTLLLLMMPSLTSTTLVDKV